MLGKAISDVFNEILKINVGDIVYTTATGTLIFFIGGVDNVFIGLLSFMLFDYVTGWIKACKLGNLDSRVARYGITKKALILIVVAMSNIVDIIMHTTTMSVNCRFVIICFYIGNEGLSILENVALMGVSVPNKLKKVLEQYKNEEVKAEVKNE